MIESDLLDYKSGYRSSTTGTLRVHDVVLKQQIGKYIPGTKFDRAEFRYHYSADKAIWTLELINVDKTDGMDRCYGTYKLTIKVAEVWQEI